MNEKQESSANQFENLLGGHKTTVQTIDGKTEEVFVRQLPIKEMPKLFTLMGGGMDQEPAQLELYCAKPPGWAETLIPQDYDRLMTEAEILNESFFAQWVRRFYRRMEVAAPGYMEKLMSVSFNSIGSSPGSPSDAGLPLTKRANTASNSSGS